MSFEDFLKNLNGKTVMICGLGRSNLPMIDMFLKNGVRLIAGDIKPEEKFEKELINNLKNKDVELRFGENYLENLNMDIIIRTPGMNFFSESLKRARGRNIVITSEVELFIDFCPCKIIGITGSDGKTTTSTIISEMLKNESYRVHLGGNIGKPLLPEIIENKIKSEDYVVLELSSFQLISMRKSPEIAVVTNISPNHLDVHKDMNEYIFAKKQIFLHQNAFSKVILNFENEITKNFRSEARGKIYFFSSSKKVDNGVNLSENGDIIFSENGINTKILNKKDIRLQGKHNLENFLAAICAVWNLVSLENIFKTAKKFAGVEHRIEFVKEIEGVSYYNDSIATSPTRAIKGALSLFSKKIILIAGGYDKKIPFDEFAKKIKEKVSVLILMGDTAEKIEKEVSKLGNSLPKIFKVQNMEEAVKTAKSYSKPGDYVVLSPGCASFGMYKDFEERGRDLKNIVNDL